MVQAIIRNHLQSFIEAKEKGISIHQYAAILPELRGRVPAIKRRIELKGEAWNRILTSESLLTFVNQNQTLSADVLNCLTTSTREVAEIERVIHLPFLEQVYTSIKAAMKNHHTGYYYSSLPVNEADILVDISLYLLKYGDNCSESSYRLTKKIVQLYKTRKVEKYEQLGKERIHYLSFIQKPYSEHITDTIDHFHTQKGHIEFYQYLQDQLPTEQLFEQIYPAIQRLLNETNEPELIKGDIIKLFKKKHALQWLSELCPTSNDIVLERELRVLAETTEKEGRAYAIIYGEHSPHYKLFQAINHSEAYLRVFMKQCIVRKKKSFIRLIADNMEIYNQLSDSHVLFNQQFNQIVNLNTLNQANLETLAPMYMNRRMEMLKTDVQLTFKEFELLYNQKHQIDMDIFYQLADLSVDNRLRACRELPSLMPLLKHFKEEELLTKLARLLRIKPMKKWFADLKINIKDGTDSQKLLLILAPEMFEKFKDEIKTGKDIQWLVQCQHLVEHAKCLSQLKALYLFENEDSKFMLEDMKLSREFILANQANIISFCEKELDHVYASIHRHRHLSASQLENLRLLTKAELVGKLEEVKFVDSDFELEIGLAISESTKKEWKSNEVSKVEQFTITESYDYETTIRIGERPVNSCLSWNNGMYSRCLLSLFDTNKKLLIAKDKNGKIVTRASLRLTKGSEEQIEQHDIKTPKKLSFIDVEGGEESVKENRKNNEELVLFLERSYSSLDDKQHKMVMVQFIQMAKEKAAKLGAKLVVSDDYSPYMNDEGFTMKDYYLFISFSKNGYQYLDSIRGQAAETLEGHYRNLHAFIQQSDKK